MKTNLILARLFQFIVFVLFTFMALVYFGALLMVALAILWYSVRVFSLVGPPAVAVAVGLAVFGYVGWLLSRMPALYLLIFDIGKELAAFGHAQIKRFDPLIAGAREGQAA
jgi:hypothetical protein